MNSRNEKHHNRFADKRCCVIIPTYNNCGTLGKVVEEVLEYTDKVIVVNDGSTDNTEDILERFPGIDIISIPQNTGKGHALRKGFAFAVNKGFKYAITIDSDGQHKPEDIPDFIDKLEEEPDAIIVGARNMGQEGVPRKSSFGHKFSNFWFRFETGIDLPDTQSGFRLYPLELIRDIRFFTKKYEFEIEVLVRAAWRGITITSIPVSVIYEEQRISHFRPFIDFTRVSILNTCLVFVALLYIKPFHFLKQINKKSIRKFFDEQLFKTGDSNLKITSSVMLGVFMGISPLWGYQMILALVLAFIFKLNKVIVIVAANISIPPIIPFIIYASYKTGGIVIHFLPGSNQYLLINRWLEDNLIPGWIRDNFPDIVNDLFQYVLGSFCFGMALSLCFGLMTYTLLKIFKKES